MYVSNTDGFALRPHSTDCAKKTVRPTFKKVRVKSMRKKKTEDAPVTIPFAKCGNYLLTTHIQVFIFFFKAKGIFSR